jgi:peptidoglycan DL-endopeptidase CwlO
LTPPNPPRGYAWFVRRLAAVTALLTVAALLVFPSSASATGGEDDPKLLQNVEAAARGYVQAKQAYDASRAKQQDLTLRLAKVEKDLVPLRKEVAAMAATAYENGRLSTVGALLTSSSQTAFLERATLIEEINKRDNDALSTLVAAEDEITRDKAAIDVEVKVQAVQTAEMGKRTDAAELALSSAGGSRANPHFIDPAVKKAAPSPRSSDGSWPRQSATVADPTSGGKLTPRMLHARAEALAAGFTWYDHCWREQSWGEHPLGRACDFATYPTGFQGTATGKYRLYGQRLAYFFVYNADALGVLYVIWYRMIWLPGLGWRNFTPSHGEAGPSGEHTNHVHLSVI